MTDRRASWQEASSAEYVMAGHPDKLADIASDAVLDAYLKTDPHARVGCEVIIGKDLIVASGQITSNARVDVPNVLRSAIREIGYTADDTGFNSNTAQIVTRLSEQSKSLNEALLWDGDGRNLCANDQAVVVGFAAHNTFGMIPPASYLAKEIALSIDRARLSGDASFLLPDGKVLVRVSGADGVLQLDQVVASVQHCIGVRSEQVHMAVSDLIRRCSQAAGLDPPRSIVVNPPSGNFCFGGPAADTGLTGRKIVSDAYGTSVPHGGGAWSGKDPTKIDRCGAYAARWVAKSLVTCQIARVVQVSITYVLGTAQPLNISVQIPDANPKAENRVALLIAEKFDLRPGALIEDLDLRRPIYQQATRSGHVGIDPHLSWEQARTDL